MNAAVETLLRRAVWDYAIEPRRLGDILEGRSSTFSLTAASLKARLLMSTSWYTLLDAFGVQGVREMLSDDVLDRVHVNDIRRRLIAARRELDAG